jgi:two-component system, LuxR family, sensor kinase FixL
MEPVKPPMGAAVRMQLFVLDWHLISLGYLVAYVALDWASYIHPFAGLSITPWDPSAGLSFALVMLFGLRYLPLLFVAALVADLLVRGWFLPTWLELAGAGMTTAGHSAALFLLSTTAMRFNAALTSTRDLLVLVVVAMLSAAVVAVANVGLVIAAGILQAAEFVGATLRSWIGDFLGIVIVSPFLLVLATGRLAPYTKLETALQLLAIVAVMMIVFGLADGSRGQPFYLLFLPIIWMALRSGLEGVTLGLAVTQVALLIGVQYTQQIAGTVVAFQLLQLVLALTGLAMGSVVSEQLQAARQLRLQQEALAKVTRIGSMGVLGAAIAHEINQPLSAISTYTELVKRHVEMGSPGKAVTIEAATKAVSQVGRVTDIVRKMRDFIRLGQSEACPYPLDQIVKETVELVRIDVERGSARLNTKIPRRLPLVHVDRVQITQVLINLIRNALEAMAAAGQKDRLIVIEAAPSGRFVEVIIRDTGPGFPVGGGEVGLLPLTSTKAEGLGLGLILCRMIVEAHGGQFRIDPSGPGGTVHFTLRIADGTQRRSES